MPVHDRPRSPRDVETNHKFIKALWGEDGQALRDSLFAKADDVALVKELNEEHGLGLKTGSQVILVDVQNGLTKSFPNPIAPGRDWYVLILPPVPLRSKEPEYREQIAWLEATFHASNDGYGM